MFGENLTTEGLLEEAVNIGDRFRIGTAELMATQPRLPCYKLGIKFGREDIIKRFLASRRTGFYFSVVREGEVGAGDEIELIGRNAHHVTILDVTKLYVNKQYGAKDLEALYRAMQVEALPERWRAYFLRKTETLNNELVKDRDDRR